MPKKITTNSKALEARERKAAAQKSKVDEEEKQKEDGERKFFL